MALSLLHSLWQGAIVGIVAFVLNARLKRAAPDVRCGAFSLLLLVLFVVWLGTLCCLYGSQARLTIFAPAVSAAGVSAEPLHQGLLILVPANTNDAPALPLRQFMFPALVAAWALGVCVLSLRHIGGFLLLNRLSRTGTIPCPPAWEERAARMAARMGVRQRIRLRCSTHIDVPFAFGLFRSSILLPFSAMTRLAPDQAEALIAHELAHFARHDVLLNLIQVCMETILFYHPVVRWLSMQIRAAREQHCDDLAIQIIGDRALYARALYSLEESRASITQLALGAKGDTSDMTNTHLIRRIRRVLGVSTPERRDPWIKGVLALGAATLGMVTFLPAHAYSPALGNTPPNAPSPSQPAAAHASNGTKISFKMSFQLDLNGDKIELSGTALTPGTLLKVNGQEERFGDLTPQQQQQLQKALKNASAAALSVSVSTPTTSQGTTFHLDLNGDKIELHSTNPTPDTPVTVNGKEGRLGDLTPQQQKQILEFQQQAKRTSPSVTVSVRPSV